MQIKKDKLFGKPTLSFKTPYKSSSNAPPAIPIINKADPILVNRPNPLIANGKMAGHINALAKPNNAIKVIAVYPVVK